MNDFEQKSKERDERLQKAAEGPTFHKFSDQDKTPQGQAAIAQGIANKERGKASYDYTKSAGADFNWPDFQPSQIGHLEPWLCYNHDMSGGWSDLNAIASGAHRRATAAYRMLGPLDNENFRRLDNETEARIAQSLTMSEGDLAATASAWGLKKSNLYSYKDYMLGFNLEVEDRKRRGNQQAQRMLDEANEIQKEEMNANIAAAKSGGLLDPIQGVSMEDWAAANAKIATGMALDEVCSVLGITKPVWDTVSAEWMARMSADTTFAISTVYGGAFTNSNIGKFAGKGAPTAAAASGAVQKVMADFELYIKIMSHQNAGAAAGKDAAAILQKYGLTAADWSSISAHWTPKMTTDFSLAQQMGALMGKFAAEFATNGV